MRIQLNAVGRLRSGPEAAMVADYLERAHGLGRQLALSPIGLTEVESKPPGDGRKEAEALQRATPEGAKIILLDERGADMTSRELAAEVGRWRDDGAPCVSFWIGGADGFDPAARDPSRFQLALGRMTWPHRLARVMAAEQIYRVVTILSANPYHRD